MVNIQSIAKKKLAIKKKKTAKRSFSLYLSILFLVYLSDDNNCCREESKRCRPHNNAAENAAKAYAQARNNVGYRSDNRNESCIRKLSINVVNVVALCTCGSKDSRIGDGGNVVTEYRTAECSGNSHNCQRATAAEDSNRDRNENAERTPRRTCGERDKSCKYEEDCGKEEFGERAVCKVVFNKCLSIEIAALSAHNAGDGPSESEDKDSGNHCLEAFREAAHNFLEGNNASYHIVNGNDKKRDRGTDSKGHTCVTVGESFDNVSGLKFAVDKACIPVVEEACVDHTADAANNEHENGDEEVANLSVGICGNTGGSLFVARISACVEVARSFCDLCVAFHFTEIKLEEAESKYHNECEKRVYVEGDSADEYHKTVAFELARNSCSPAGDGSDDANGSSRSINDVSKLRAGNLEFVRNGTHNGTNRQAVEVVIHEDKAAKTCCCGESTAFVFDLISCPIAVRFRAAGSLHKNYQNAEDYEENDDRNVTADLFAHNLIECEKCFKRIAASVHHCTDKDTEEERNVNLLRYQCEHDGDDSGQKRP